MTRTTLAKIESLINLAGKDEAHYPRPRILEGDTLLSYVQRVAQTGDQDTQQRLGEILIDLASEGVIHSPLALMIKLPLPTKQEPVREPISKYRSQI